MLPEVRPHRSSFSRRPFLEFMLSWTPTSKACRTMAFYVGWVIVLPIFWGVEAEINIVRRGTGLGFPFWGV